MKKFYISIFLILFCVGSVWSGEFDDIKKSAEKGDSSAQNNLGDIYFDGKMGKRNYKWAAYWYQKSAGQGNATAQYNLGLMYNHGKIGERDDIWAVYWYKKSAKQGYAIAQNKIGEMYESGFGTPQN